MKSRFIITIACLVSGTLAFSVVVFAHGADKHNKRHQPINQMIKLHAMMPMFSIASAELESALEKGDAATAKIQADRILAAAPDLKKSRPHKNIKQRKKFVGLATKFEEAITTTVDLIKIDDLSGAKAAFKKVEEVCAACHAKFRD